MSKASLNNQPPTPPGSEVESVDLGRVESELSHGFGNQGLLLQALTHPSFANEHPDYGGEDNQRLEFLGDAVLDFVSASWVYHRYPSFDEGRMTRLRAALVRTRMLASFARKVGIDRALRLGRGEEASGGRRRDANLCDAFEAVIGALYLDGGLAPVRTFAEPLLASHADAILAAQTDWDAKSRLQEWSQAELGVTPSYRIVEESGPDHAKTFVAEVLLNGDAVGRGVGNSKQVAEQAAAQVAWRQVQQD